MLKTMGILMVLMGAAGTGGSMALAVYRSNVLLRQLLAAMELLHSELSFRRTPLPEAMEALAHASQGAVAAFFQAMAQDLALRQERSVAVIMRKNLMRSSFTPQARRILQQLGNGLGQYDLDSQLRAVSLAEKRLQERLDEARAQQAGRIRSYCTLGVCAGLAIAILAW